MSATARTMSRALPPAVGRLLGVLAAALVAALVPSVFGSDVIRLGQYDLILSLIMMAIGLNITLGLAGLLFLGPSALFAVGGYTAAICATHWTAFQTLPMMIISACAMSLAVAAVIVLPALRISGFYLGMVTLFLALAVPALADNLSLTGGAEGLSLSLVPTFYQHPGGQALYFIGAGIVIVMSVFVWALKNSVLGRRFGAVMSSEQLAQSVGVSAYRTKLMAFFLGAIPCAIGGAFYVYSQQFISSSSVDPTLSIYVLAGLTIGGSGTIVGPIVGATFVGIATEFLGGFHLYEGIAYGAVLIAVASAAPDGLIGLTRSVLGRLPVLTGKFGLSESEWPAHGGSAVVGTGSAETEAGPRGHLVLRGLEKRFGGVQAVAGIDLAVLPGTVHALVGPNGSGKTTVLNLISGFYRSDAGEILLDGERIDRLKPDRIAKLGVARTFQTPKLMTSSVAGQNVMIGLDSRRADHLLAPVLHTPKSIAADRAARSEVVELMSRLGLGHVAGVDAALLPHGTQRLVEIARAAASRPRVLLLDEPAAGLIGPELEHLGETIRIIARGGVSVLIVEHNLPLVFGIAEVVTVLHDGSVIATGTPSEISADDLVRSVYVGTEYRDEARSVDPRSV